VEKTEKHNWKNKIFELIKKYRTLEIAGIIIFLALLWVPTIYANLSTKNHRFDLTKTPVSEVPDRKVALVFGAGVLPSGEPTPYLKERVNTAVKLYQAGKVQKILVSGDNSTKHYNEPVAMKKLAVSLGAKGDDVVEDYAGYSTYDSCFRAVHIFGVHSAILVTQGYHLPRAVMTCTDLGINSIGVSALHSERDFTASFIVREWLSTDKAVIQNVIKPQPTVGGKPEPIKF
jgi:vancomycin permeability regulator SanA